MARVPRTLRPCQFAQCPGQPAPRDWRHSASPPYLLITRQTVRFNTASDHWLDAAELPALLAASEPESDALERAVSLYRGPFLQGFSTPDSAAFEEWLLLTREQFGRQIREALNDSVQLHEERGAYEQALPHAWRQVELDPWREGAQRQLMRLLARDGQRGAALAQYEACRQALADELGVEPRPETTRLYEQIRDVELKLPTIEPDADPAPEPVPPTCLPGRRQRKRQRPLFVAREQELARLEGSLEDALAGQGQVVFVTGGPAGARRP